MDMDPSSSMDMDPGSTPADIMMVPWLHFTGGDYLFFESWHPSSAGAIAGACIGLLFLAIFDRWVSAARSVLEYRWRHRGLALTMRTSPTPSSDVSEKSLGFDSSGPAIPNSTRVIPPFILAHDLPRGLIHAAQSLLTYLLMLAVMTFNVPFIICIVAGLGIGEMIFGRMGDALSGH